MWYSSRGQLTFLITLFSSRKRQKAKREAPVQLQRPHHDGYKEQSRKTPYP